MIQFPSPTSIQSIDQLCSIFRLAVYLHSRKSSQQVTPPQRPSERVRSVQPPPLSPSFSEIHATNEIANYFLKDYNPPLVPQPRSPLLSSLAPFTMQWSYWPGRTKEINKKTKKGNNFSVVCFDFTNVGKGWKSRVSEEATWIQLLVCRELHWTKRNGREHQFEHIVIHDLSHATNCFAQSDLPCNMGCKTNKMGLVDPFSNILKDRCLYIIALRTPYLSEADITFLKTCFKEAVIPYVDSSIEKHAIWFEIQHPPPRVMPLSDRFPLQQVTVVAIREAKAFYELVEFEGAMLTEDRRVQRFITEQKKELKKETERKITERTAAEIELEVNAWFGPDNDETKSVFEIPSVRVINEEKTHFLDYLKNKWSIRTIKWTYREAGEAYVTIAKQIRLFLSKYEGVRLVGNLHGMIV